MCVKREKETVCKGNQSPLGLYVITHSLHTLCFFHLSTHCVLAAHPNHTLILSVSLSLTHTLCAGSPLTAHTYTLSLSHTRIPSPTPPPHTLILSLSHSSTHALCAESPFPAHAYTLSHTHTHTYPSTRTFSHTDTLSHTQTHTRTVCS